VTSDDDKREGLIAPLDEWQALDSTQRADEMRAATEFALQTPMGSRERQAGAGMVIAVGNYAYLSPRRDDALIAAAEARLKELEGGDRSKSWG
jgi:hypothetical protein